MRAPSDADRPPRLRGLSINTVLGLGGEKQAAETLEATNGNGAATQEANGTTDAAEEAESA